MLTLRRRLHFSTPRAVQVRLGRRMSWGHAPGRTILGDETPPSDTKRGAGCSFRNPTASSSDFQLVRHAAALLPFSPYNEMASLPESRARGDVLQVVKNLGPDVLVLREGGGACAPQPRAGEVVLFTSFFTAGLAPPFSEFLKYVLSHYGIHLAHLVPNSIVILSTFAHFCEMFLGIPPNLHLFRYFYFLRPNTSDGAIGSCSFQRRNDSGLEAYIPLTLKDKWEGWTQHWCYALQMTRGRVCSGSRL